jgi:hypothetical protein
MPRENKNLMNRASVVLGACCTFVLAAGTAVAGPVSLSGAYSYNYTSTGADSSCQAAGDDGARNNFSSSPSPWGGSNTLGGSDTLTFSICHGNAGLDGGEFTLTSGDDTATGIFSGVLVGISDDTGLLPDGGSLDGGALFDGTFTITSADGVYASALGDVGTFEVNTGALQSADQANGEFAFQATPEPVSLLLGGSGVLLMALAKFSTRKRSLHEPVNS